MYIILLIAAICVGWAILKTFNSFGKQKYEIIKITDKENKVTYKILKYCIKSMAAPLPYDFSLLSYIDGKIPNFNTRVRLIREYLSREHHIDVAIFSNLEDAILYSKYYEEWVNNEKHESQIVLTVDDLNKFNIIQKS